MSVMAHSTFQTSLEKAKRITRRASEQVDELVFAYGHLEEESPERRVLESRVREILLNWASEIWECGGQPQDLWTVTFQTEDGLYQWQYPCSQFFERPPEKFRKLSLRPTNT